MLTELIQREKSTPIQNLNKGLTLQKGYSQRTLEVMFKLDATLGPSAATALALQVVLLKGTQLVFHLAVG